MKEKDLLKEWYDTGQVGNGEEVVVSRMPDDFRGRRNQNPNPCPEENPVVNHELELEIKRAEDDPENQEENPSGKTITKAQLRDLMLKIVELVDGI